MPKEKAWNRRVYIPWAAHGPFGHVCTPKCRSGAICTTTTHHHHAYELLLIGCWVYWWWWWWTARPPTKAKQAQVMSVIVWAQVCFYYNFSTNLFFSFRYFHGDDCPDTTSPPNLWATACRGRWGCWLRGTMMGDKKHHHHNNSNNNNDAAPLPHHQPLPMTMTWHPTSPMPTQQQWWHPNDNDNDMAPLPHHQPLPTPTTKTWHPSHWCPPNNNSSTPRTMTMIWHHCHIANANHQPQWWPWQPPSYSKCDQGRFLLCFMWWQLPPLSLVSRGGSCYFFNVMATLPLTEQGGSQCFLNNFINEYYYLQIIVQSNGCNPTTGYQPVSHSCSCSKKGLQPQPNWTFKN